MSLWKAAHAIRPRLCSPNTVFHYSIYTKKTKKKQKSTPKIITKSSKNLPKWIQEPVKKWSRKKDKKKTPKKTKMCQNGSSLGGGGEFTKNPSFFDPGPTWAPDGRPECPKSPKWSPKTAKITQNGQKITKNSKNWSQKHKNKTQKKGTNSQKNAPRYNQLCMIWRTIFAG